MLPLAFFERNESLNEPSRRPQEEERTEEREDPEPRVCPERGDQRRPQPRKPDRLIVGELRIRYDGPRVIAALYDMLRGPRVHQIVADEGLLEIHQRDNNAEDRERHKDEKGSIAHA